MDPKLLQFIAGFEGFDPVMRLDGAEKTPTIGHGFNLLRIDARAQIQALGLDWQGVRSGLYALTRAQAAALLQPVAVLAEQDARWLFGDCWTSLAQPVQWILVDLAYNLGLSRFKKFTGFAAAIRARRWALAGCELLLTKIPGEELSGYWRETSRRAVHHVATLAAWEKQGDAASRLLAMARAVAGGAN